MPNKQGMQLNENRCALVVEARWSLPVWVVAHGLLAQNVTGKKNVVVQTTSKLSMEVM